MSAIKHLFHISAPKEKVFEALTTLEGLSNWWTTQTSGDTSLNGVLEFRFGNVWVNKMKVVDIEQDKLVSWKCVSGADDWLNTSISFALSESEGKTRVLFVHDDWPTDDDFYASCSFAWGRYMESLRQYCQTGKGEAFGSENYRQ